MTSLVTVPLVSHRSLQDGHNRTALLSEIRQALQDSRSAFGPRMIIRKSHGKSKIHPHPSGARHHHGAPREVALVAAHKGALVILAEFRRESPEESQHLSTHK
jgi:hypothetical protein